jgi:hypothetical protein
MTRKKNRRNSENSKQTDRKGTLNVLFLHPDLGIGTLCHIQENISFLQILTKY